MASIQGKTFAGMMRSPSPTRPNRTWALDEGQRGYVGRAVIRPAFVSRVARAARFARLACVGCVDRKDDHH